MNYTFFFHSVNIYGEPNVLGTRLRPVKYMITNWIQSVPFQNSGSCGREEDYT